MTDERWWDDDEPVPSGASAPSGDAPLRPGDDGPAAPPTVAPGLLVEPPAAPTPADRAPPPGPATPDSSVLETEEATKRSWVDGTTTRLGLVAVGVMVVGLLVAMMIFRDSGGSPTELEPAIDAIDEDFAASAALVDEEAPDRSELGLDGRFTEPRAWQDGENVVVAYAREGSAADEERIREGGVLAALAQQAAPDPSTVVIARDELVSTDPLVRVVELRIAPSSTIVTATATDADHAVVTVSASGQNPSAVDVGRLAGVGIAALE